MMLANPFFDQDPQALAVALLGKILCVRYRQYWLRASIIETEAYYLHDKASHASLGYTEKRQSLFMAAGTIYMYYARGGDSLNISARGMGNAVLIKSALPYLGKNAAHASQTDMIAIMQSLNPSASGGQRKLETLCSGQTLLCRSLGLKVKKWDKKNFQRDCFYVSDEGYYPKKIIQARRLGIPKGRDEHYFYRFIDYDKAAYCTSNPLRKRYARCGHDYFVFSCSKDQLLAGMPD